MIGTSGGQQGKKPQEEEEEEWNAPRIETKRENMTAIPQIARALISTSRPRS